MIREHVKIAIGGERDPTDAEMFDRLHTVAFNYGEIRRAIAFDRATGKIDLETWHDEGVPACYRARVAEIALVTFERFKGRKYNEELLHAFIIALRRDVYAHLEPIEPEIKFHRSHDEWPT